MDDLLNGLVISLRWCQLRKLSVELLADAEDSFELLMAAVDSPVVLNRSRSLRSLKLNTAGVLISASRVEHLLQWLLHIIEGNGNKLRKFEVRPIAMSSLVEQYQACSGSAADLLLPTCSNTSSSPASWSA